jgi:cytochrome c oxidase assembly protein subunit 11
MSQTKRSSTKSLVTKLLFTVVGMFGFGFAMVPLYDVICDITGLNGKTDDKSVVIAEPTSVGERLITVQFMAQNSAGMDWDFGANDAQVKVHPGEVKVVSYYAKNAHNYAMTGQAIPSVAPNEAAQYLKKLECFCFQEQVLQPKEQVEMGIRFFIDESIPDHITKLTLSYSLFDITDYEASETAVTLR